MYYQPEVIYREIGAERKNSVLRYIGNRVLGANKNFLCAIVGQTGMGKSWAGLSMCEDYSQMFNIPFDPKIHVISSLERLLELIVNKELEKNIRIGTALLFEEPQVEHSAETWQSELNQMLTVLLSIFRKERLVVFFSVPYLNMISKKSRTLFHAEFRILGFDKGTGITTIKPRFLEYNQDLDKFYRKRLLVMYKVEGKRPLIKTKINRWKVERASKEITDVYEEFNERFKNEIILNLHNKVKNLNKEEDKTKKAREFMRIKEIYETEGENYVKILSEFPHISPRGAENLINLVKRSLNATMKAGQST